jgi:fused signal recognition particle receptor
MMENTDLVFYGLGGIIILAGLFLLIRMTRSRRRRGSQKPNVLQDVSTADSAKHFKQETENLLEQEAGVAKLASSDDFAGSRTLKEALSNTEQTMWGRIRNLFSNELAERNSEEIEEILYTSDLGPKTVQLLMDSVQAELSKSAKSELQNIKDVLKKEFTQIFLSAHIQEPEPDIFAHLQMRAMPTVWLVVGVNGVGKTTTIGKLAAHLAKSGKKVLVAAGDTFRAAAESQLKVWTERAQVEIFSPPQVTDPSAVAFDAVQKAKAQGYDVVIIDTAGRLHTQSNLMEELKKLKRVITKVIPEAPHETLIVLDANSGQNALSQAREFHASVGLTGVVLTKMDGTAKGGVAVGLANELRIPIRLIGVGEKIGDLRAFSSSEFINSIL